MHPAALDERARAEGVANRLVQGLGPVDHEQQRALRVKPALDQVCEQRLACGGVFGGSFAQPQYVFFAVAIDPDRGQHHMLGEVHPVDHHREQFQGAKLALRQRREFLCGPGHEPLADRALAHPVNPKLWWQWF